MMAFRPYGVIRCFLAIDHFEAATTQHDRICRRKRVAVMLGSVLLS